MKKLLGLVVILSALVLSSYYGMGLITERTLKKNIEIINQTNGLFVDIARYNRGWYTSTAVLNWRMHIPERLVKNDKGESTTVPAQDYVLQMPLTIYHGPIIYSDSGLRFGLGYARSDVEMPPMYAAKFATLFTSDSTKPKANLSLFVNYFNNSKLHVGLPKFKLTEKESGNQFEWDGMDSHVSASSSLKNIDGGFTVEGASLKKSTMQATLGKIQSSYHLHQTDAGIYLGEANLSLASLVVTEKDQVLADLEQFSANSSSEIENGLFSSHFQTSLGKLTGSGKVYGPGVLEVSIKNLDADVLADLNTQANKMQQGPEADRQQALLAMIPALPKLFGKGAQFEVSKLSLVVPEGTISGDLLVSLPQGDVGNPFQLLQKVQGHAMLKVPAIMLKNLMTLSAKQTLLTQPSLQQTMVQKMQSPDSSTEAPVPTVPSEPTQAVPATPAAPADGSVAQVPTVPAPAKPMTAAEVDQQAATEADLKLSNMVKTGVITLQGTEYVIDLSLAQGQLSVNGKPFTPAMMQF